MNTNVGKPLTAALAALAYIVADGRRDMGSLLARRLLGA
jgi:hypothetical protein